MRAISPVIATVIILAVTIAIAVAVIGWITGLFGATTTGTSQIKLLPDSYLCTDNTYTYVVVHLKNEGAAAAHVYKIEVEGVGANTTIYYSTTFSGNSAKDFISSTSNTTSDLIIKPGEDYYAGVIIKKPISVGATYTVKVYTKSGSVIPTTIVASDCS